MRNMSLLCKRISKTARLINKLNTKCLENQICQRFISDTNAGRVGVPPGYFKLSLIGLSFGAVVGTGYSIHQLNKTTTHIVNEQTTIPVIDHVPEIKPSRQVIYPGDRSNLKLTLYQYQTCPFCCKVRAYLDYYGISYDVIEVDPVLRQSIKWSDYKKVPILVANVGDVYQPLNDSSMIISAITSHLQDDNSTLPDIVKCYPTILFTDESGSKKHDIMNKYFLMYNGRDPKRSKEEIDEERKWRKWTDEVLVHTISPNVYRTREEAYQAFNWFSDTGDWERLFPSWERNLMIYVGANAMWVIGKRLKTKYNLKDDVRLSFYDECNRWMKAVKAKGSPFLGGAQPNLADLSVYGVLSSIEGCDAFSDLISYTRIGEWYYAVKAAVKNNTGASLI